jgi:hypothetical protein
MSGSFNGFVFLFSLVFASGCSGHKNLYDWGSYDASIAAMYSDPGSYILDEDIEKLGREIEKAEPARVPPGKAAHIGFLYSLKGMDSEALRFFEMEKRNFPDSKLLMDRLISRTNSK